MEVTQGLITNLVKTKSVERVLAPIASQISLLIILNESNKLHEIEDVRQGNKISQCAEGVIRAIYKFLQIGQKQIKSSVDSVFVNQMKLACESLDLSSCNLTVSCKRYEADVRNKQNGDLLIQAGKDVLHSVLKVLLVSDDATVRKILGVIKQVQEKLHLVDDVTNKEDFLPAFKAFSETLILLITMLKSRQVDLNHLADREWLITVLSHLQKSIPSLSVSIQTYLKYINNPKAETGKSSVVKQVYSSLLDIQYFLENKPSSDRYMDTEEPGHFVMRISQILDSLSEEKRNQPLNDLEANLAVVIGHSMAVAHFCLNFNRNLIIRSCQRILQVKGRVLHLQPLTVTNPGIQEIRYDYNEVCEIILDEICELEKHVNISLLHLIVDLFKETIQPVERLLKTALQTDLNSVSQSSSSLVSFTDHSDQVCQVANLVAASSTNSKRVREIRSSAYHLEKLDPDIVGAASNVAKDLKNTASVQHLKLLIKNWKLELSALVATLDQMSDPHVFLDISEKRILEGTSHCKSMIKQVDVMSFKQSLRDVLNYSKRVRDVTFRIIDNHTDAIFRNGFLLFVNNLQTARLDVSEAGNNLISNFTNPSLQDTTIRRLNILEDSVSNMKKGLSSNHHLPLLHPNRQTARKPLKLTKKKGNKMAPMPPTTADLNHKKTWKSQDGAVSGKENTCPGISVVSNMPVPESLSVNIGNNPIHSNDDFCEPDNPQLTSQVNPSFQASTAQTAPASQAPTVPQTSLPGNTSNPQTFSISSKIPNCSPGVMSTPDDYQKGYLGSERVPTSTLPACKSTAGVSFTDIERPDSVIRILARKFVNAAVNSNRKLMDNITADILRLTNHIVECSTNLLKHCPQLERKSQMKTLYREVEELAPQMVQEARFVCAGDCEALTDLHEVSTDWYTKYDKLKIYVDVAVDKWSKCTDNLDRIIEDRNTHDLKLQLQRLDVEKQNMCDLLTLATTLPFQSSSSENIMDYLTEQGKDIENLTATITTTSHMQLQTGCTDDEGCTPILELCREWNVCMTCVTSELQTLSLGIIAIGSETLPTIRDITLLNTQKIKLKLIEETEMLKDLLLMVSYGDEKLKEKCAELLFDMFHIPEELSSKGDNPKQRNSDIYKQLTTNIIISKWILTCLPCVRTITLFTAGFTWLIDDLLETLVDATQNKTAQKQTDDFQSKILTIRQRVLQGIVLSPELKERAVVRKCLDDISELLPHVIDNSQVTDESKRKAAIWPLKHKFGARFKRISTTLENMTQVKVSLVPELTRLLNPDEFTEANQQKTPKQTSRIQSYPPSITSTNSKRQSKASQISSTPTSRKPNNSPSSKPINSAVSCLLPKNRAVHIDNYQSLSNSVLQPLLRDQDVVSLGPSPRHFRHFREGQTSTPKDNGNESFIQKQTTLTLKGDVSFIEREIDRWNENNNPVVIVASQLTSHVTNMVSYCIGEGTITSIEEMIRVSEKVADCCVKLRTFAVTVSNLTLDPSHTEDLLLLTDQLASSSHQLKMIAKVFVSATHNYQAERILTRNACDLMKAVREMFTLAEVMCLKGLSLTGNKTREEMDALALLKSWQRRLLEQRNEEIENSTIDELGLRRIDEPKPPSLTDLLDPIHYN